MDPATAQLSQLGKTFQTMVQKGGRQVRAWSLSTADRDLKMLSQQNFQTRKRTQWKELQTSVQIPPCSLAGQIVTLHRSALWHSR